MTYTEMKKKVLALIEELNPNSAFLTDDPDISTKYIHVANQVMTELMRMKKIPKYIELDVDKGDLIDFDRLSMFTGYEVYQLSSVSGVNFMFKADGTILKFLERGTVEIECYVYPTQITTENEATYTYELSADVLEIMPYGIAADLLKSDVSAEYGTVYATRYESMLQRLDPRYATPMITFDGGVDV